MNIRKTRGWAVLMRSLRPLGRLLPKKVYRSLWSHGSFNATLMDAKFTMLHDGGPIANDIFWRGVWYEEQGATYWFAKIVRKMDCFIDVGSNVGIYTLLAKSLNPQINIISIEPSSTNFALLKENLELNSYDVATLQAAATDAAGPVTLFDFPGLSYSASLEGIWRSNTVRRTVDGICLDELVAEKDIIGNNILVKIDVEGHELSVLRGALKLIAVSPPPVFLIEIIRQPIAEEIIEFLSTRDYQYIYIHEDNLQLEDKTTDFRDISANKVMGNYLVVPCESPLLDPDCLMVPKDGS